MTARKYRPLLFHELVAQEHVTGTLQNAIRLDRLAHAYLFTGPRGVGKTTAARILAKAINCTTPPEDRKDGAEPCRTCDSCRSFEEGRNLNIIEIDAASNNKVDDVRELRDTVRIPPQGNRKKVYIVDEVHMLTNQAFNALLKTLEEPPPHVLFIFATTEPHKVLPTIQSRCQRFDFRRIPVQEIVGRLEDICQSEGVTADDGALMLLARKGDGALRDALSVFDQAVSLCGTDLKLDALVEALGVVSEELYFEVTDCIAQRDVPGMLGLVDRVVSGGFDLQEFLDGLAEHLRNLLVALSMPDTDLIEASETTRRRYVKSAGAFTENHVLRLLAGIDQTLDGLRTARQPRLRLELALIRMASLPSSTDIRSALAQVQALSEQGERLDTPPTDEPVSSRKPVQPASSEPVSTRPEQPGPAASRKDPPGPDTPMPETDATPATEAKEADGSGSGVTPTKDSGTDPPGPPKPASAPATTPAQPAPESRPSRESPAGGASPKPAPTPSPVFSPPPLAPSQSEDVPEPPVPTPDPNQRTLFGKGSIFGAPALATTADSGTFPAGSGHPASAAVLVAPQAGVPPEGWETVVAGVMATKIHMGAFLHHAEPEIREPTTLTLVVPDDFHARVLKEAAADILEQTRRLGHEDIVRLEFDVNGRIRAESDISTQEIDPQSALRKLCEEYPAMALLMERFGGEIVW